MRRTRSRTDVARSLRADLPETTPDDELVERLSLLAAASPVTAHRPSLARRRAAAVTAGLVVLTTGGGLGVAYGAGLVDPPWSQPEAPSPARIEPAPQPEPLAPAPSSGVDGETGGGDDEATGRGTGKDPVNDPGKDPGKDEVDRGTKKVDPGPVGTKPDENAVKKAQKKAEQAAKKAAKKVQQAAKKAQKKAEQAAKKAAKKKAQDGVRPIKPPKPPKR